MRFGGTHVTGIRPCVLARRGLAYVLENRQVLPYHTVEDNLAIAAKKGPGGEDNCTIARIWRDLPLLERLRHRAADRFSGGQQQNAGHFCLGVASHAVVINKGSIVYRDDVAGLRASAEIRSRYLAM